MKTKIVYKKRPKTLAQLKKDLTKAFNAYIRFRDSKDMVFTCISCGNTLPISEMHAGHFIPSTYQSVRFSEENVNGQCRNCNVWKRGNIIEYRPRLITKIGKKRVEALEARRHDLFKPTREWLEEKIAYYKSLTQNV